jgi:hypothetical protein
MARTIPTLPANDPMVAFATRLRSSVLAALQDKAEREGVTVTSITNRALCKVLGIEIPKEPTK